MNLFKTIIGGIAFAWAALFGSHGAQYAATVNQLPTVVANYQDSLAVQENTGDSSITLVSGEDSLGRSLSGFYCFTVDPNTSITEYECGNASGTIVSNVIRGVDPVNPNATSSALIFFHRRGAAVVISDYTPIANLERIAQGLDTFPSGTVLQYNPNVTNAEVGAAQNNIASVAYVASTSYSGTVNGSVSAKGIYQEATPAQIASGTGQGSTGADLIIPNRNSCIVASTTPCSVIASSSLDPSFVSGTPYTFTNPTFIGATTTFVNATSGVLMTNASGTVSAISTSTLLAGFPYMVRNYITTATSTAGGAPTSTFISTTLPAATTTSIYNIVLDSGGSGVNDATTTLMINGTQIFQCRSTFSNPEYHYQFTIYMANSTSSEYMSGVSSGCASVPATSNNASSSIFSSTFAIPFSTTSTQSVVLFGNTQTGGTVTTYYESNSY